MSKKQPVNEGSNDLVDVLRPSPWDPVRKTAAGSKSPHKSRTPSRSPSGPELQASTKDLVGMEGILEGFYF